MEFSSSNFYVLSTMKVLMRQENVVAIHSRIYVQLLAEPHFVCV